VIETVRRLGAVSIRGNHDRVAAGEEDPDAFNPYARTASLWTRTQLSTGHRTYLASLPVGPLSTTVESQLVHGALTDEDDYILSDLDAAENLLLSNCPITFFGHTHLPVVYERLHRYEDPEEFCIDPHTQILVNPGSVGQPRNGDPRASFLIWDVDRRKLEFYRVEYPISRTQARMRDAGLPAYLIDRLSVGR
jgi:diadenosine tetraphosphatase ApaH/serine/threonine PP2A family protein phosphatase